jgi:DNA-directed RNA polymerase subunit RPC12/RpoP
MSDSKDRYYGPDWTDIRQKVIESDGGGCVVCFSEENLVVHHREPLKRFDSHEEANDLDNLATLCKRCHRRIESIQKPHTRRGLEHFINELEAEDVDVSEEFIEYLCHKKPKSDAPKASCCSGSDCFYPVKPSDWQCPRCGKSTGRLSRIDPHSGQKSDSEKKEYKCEYCGDISKFATKPLNQHGCRESANWHHHYEECQSADPDYGGGLTCSECGFSAKSDGQLIQHLVNKHDFSRIKAKKLSLDSEGE